MTTFITYLSETAYRHASVRKLLWLAALILVCYLWVFPAYQQKIVPEEGPPLLDLQFCFSPEEGWDTLNQYGEAGRKAYFSMLLLADMVFPLIYGLFLILLSSRVLNHCLPEHSFWRILNLGAIDAVIFDLCENTGIMIMLSRFPQEAVFASRVASVCGAMKWIVLGMVTGMILLGILCRLKQEPMA